MPELIGKLFPGPLDIVGDIHGEIDALLSLVSAMGYDSQGGHPEGRRLVFIGDLIDRGPDSPAVLEWVQSLLERDLAQCILGNHELNALRHDAKSGNAWLIDPTHPEQQPGGEFSASKVVSDSMRVHYEKFLDTLPLALAREDLRVVHAAWDGEAVRQLSAESGSVTQVYQRYNLPTKMRLKEEGVTERAQAEKRQWNDALLDRHATVPLLRGLGEQGERMQMSNPVRILTSGVERMAARPFWSSGRWRMCDRIAWWDEYTDETPVVIGHYWRRLRPALYKPHSAGRPPDIFQGVEPHEWMGPKGNVFCVDYSVGGRFEERRNGTPPGTHTHLCALRWPERQLWGENGRLSPPAQAA